MPGAEWTSSHWVDMFASIATVCEIRYIKRVKTSLWIDPRWWAHVARNGGPHGFDRLS